MNSRIREDVKELFQLFCEVAKPVAPGSEGIVILKYPESYDEKKVLDEIPKFVYPCEFDNSSVQHFSFVFTYTDSKWTFGFCRHDSKTSTALVYLSSLPWHDVFLRILNTTADLIRSCEAHDLTQFLRGLLAYKMPEPGIELSLKLNDKLGSFHCIVPAQKGLPSIHDNRNLTEYYNAVDATNMIAIFASMLQERRIIMKSTRLPRLSACVQAANTLLYPMCWQHIYIPLMPRQITDYLDAPTPYLIGVPTATWESLRHRSEISDVVILDLDGLHDHSVRTLDSSFNDTEKLPPEITKFLKSQLRDTAEMQGDGLSRTFLQALVRIIGGYRDGLKFEPGKEITFSKEAFVESRPTMQPFLRGMLQLQMFEQFIQERLAILNASLGFSDEFEKEARNYMSKSNSASHDSLWVKKHSTAIIKSVKANLAVKSAVRKVKESGKDVKLAYRDIKTRMKNDGHPSHGEPSNSTFHRSRPRTIGSPITPAATYTKHRAKSSVVSNSRSNEYVPLSSPYDDANSPPPDDEVTNATAGSEMDLMAEIERTIKEKLKTTDESPPVNRNLKPVRSLDGSTSPNQNDVTTPKRPHAPLSRGSWSVPLESPATPLFTDNLDPFGFLPNATTSAKPPSDKMIDFDSLDSSQSNTYFQPLPETAAQHQFLTFINEPIPPTFQSGQPFIFQSFQPNNFQGSHLSSFQGIQTNSFQGSQPISFQTPPQFLSLPTLQPYENSLTPAQNFRDFQESLNLSPPKPQNPFTTIPHLVPPPPLSQRKPANQYNGTRDLIRLDSESSHENSLSRESSEDSIKFKTGITNPLYPYTELRSLDVKPFNGALLPPVPNNTSFLHSNRQPASANEKDTELLQEYGISLEGLKAASDPFDMPFDSNKKTTPSAWTTFE